ncbi:unnamed protein product [Dibothriocephalus latus]|uniref:Ribosome biogenesis protein NOP53 n=1 Tax=Dibothriocephalus latus TaxID=60516 RepID=A0A3P6U9Z9_DIBLA|nr:unnamed protein product [Dibothriocephalus latus]
MKNRSKNKKKQWRHLLTDLASDLHVTSRKAEISSGDFSIKQKNKLKVQKGDKEAAKQNPDIPTAVSIVQKTPFRRGKAAVRASVVDVWEEGAPTPKPKPPATKTTAESKFAPLTCVAGQSYNPSIVDHQMLLFQAAQDEVKQLAKEEPQRPKKRRCRTAKDRKVRYHLAFFYCSISLSLSLKNPKASAVALKPKKAKTPKQKEKQMHTDLDNTCLHFQSSNGVTYLCYVVFFLQADDNWTREVEFRRNKLPRARKTLGITKATTPFVRRK